jgi:hypothetical protein
LRQRLVEEEPDTNEQQRDPDWSGRPSEREIAQLMAGAGGSHSRTDPDLVGPDRTDTTLSAEEAAMHVIQLLPRNPG